MRINAGNLKKGDFINHLGDIWQVVKTDFNFQGRGMAVVRIKIKSTTSGKNIDLTLKSSADVERADIESKQMQYLYHDGQNLFFMDEATYNQLEVSVAAVEQIYKFFKEGEKYYVLLYNEKPLAVRPPSSVKLRVTYTDAAVKGDTVSGAKKPATLETGITIMVPLFIKAGETIVVNPETGQYVERVKG